MALQLSGLVKEAKKAVIGLNGRVTRSAFYLTNLTTSEAITLCINGINLSDAVIKAHRINITAISLKESITS